MVSTRMAAAAIVAFFFGGAVAFAQPRVAVLDIAGKGGGAGAITGFTAALKKLRGVEVETTKVLQAEAKRQGVADRVPDDARSLAGVTNVLQIDAVVRGELAPADGKRKKDQVLMLTVYNGGDGKALGDHTVEVPGGKLNPKVWTAAAEAVEPDLRRGDWHPPAPEPVVVEPVRPTPVPRDVENEEALEDEAPVKRAAGADMVRLRAGLGFRSRSFEYTAAPDSTQFAEDGISYDSSLAPGLAIEAELYPLVSSVGGVAGDFGLTAHFAKYFLSTKQKVTRNDGATENHDLDTNQSHFGFGLRYRHRFGSTISAPELRGQVGLNFSTFELQDNPEYRGTNYRYVDLAVGFQVPLGTPYLGADVEFRYVPTADAGDTVKELGGSMSTQGYGLTAGLLSRVGGGFNVRGTVDYLVLDSDVSGTGRGGRIGKSAEDSYLGLKFLAGYDF